MRDAKQWAQFAGIAGAIYFIAHCITVIIGNEEHLMSWLYDDAFYYLIVAKHFSERHISSFDGVTVTSGYHPLWMWLCSAVYGLRGRLDMTYVRLCMAMTLCISASLLLGALREKIRKGQTGWLWALGLGATSYSALNNGSSVMEWPLVLLFWTMLHWLVVSSLERSEGGPGLPRWLSMTGGFALGMAGSLSRTDFGLITVCYLSGALLVARLFREQNPVPTAGMAVAGAVTGLGIDSLYNHAMTGVWVQQSAQVKEVFASLTAPFNPVPALWQFARVLLYLPPLDLPQEHKATALRLTFWLLLPFTALAIGFGVSSRRLLLERVRRELFVSPSNTIAVTSACVGILSYIVLYSLNSQGTYGWYTATVTGFILVLMARVFSLIRGSICAAIVLPLMAVNVAAAHYSGGNARAQYQEVTAGRLMHYDHAGARMGGGDVGKPSFYNNGTMFNLDGLMNNEVLPYLVAGRFHCYILKRHIEYLSDMGTISESVTNLERQKRGEEPLPWAQYFILVRGRDPMGEPAAYRKTDFDAILHSNECGDQR